MSAISLAALSSAWMSLSDFALAASIDCSSEMYHRLSDGPEATNILPLLWGDVPYKNPVPAEWGECPRE